MGWLIALGILTGLAILPLGVSVKYDSEGPLVKVILGPIRLLVFPRPKKVKKEKKQKNTQKKAPEKSSATVPEAPKKQPLKTQPDPAPKPKEPSGGSWTDFLPFVKLGLSFLGNFRRKLRVKYLYLKLIMAGDDPCDLGVNYGRAWAAVGNLMPQLERFLAIKKRKIAVECNFYNDKTLVIARLDITITLGRIISLLVCYGFRAIKEFFKFRKKRKGGA